MHNHHANQETLACLRGRMKFRPIRLQYSSSQTPKDERLCLPPNAPNPIETSPLSPGAPAIDGCVAVGAIVL